MWISTLCRRWSRNRRRAALNSRNRRAGRLHPFREVASRHPELRGNRRPWRSAGRADVSSPGLRRRNAPLFPQNPARSIIQHRYCRWSALNRALARPAARLMAALISPTAFFLILTLDGKGLEPGRVPIKIAAAPDGLAAPLYRHSRVSGNPERQCQRPAHYQSGISGFPLTRE